MKVIISVGGKFHAFHLARQLQKRGYLERIITSYPRFRLSEEDLPKNKIVSLPLKEVLQKISHYIKFFNFHKNLEWKLASIFDRQASKFITTCDIFVGWSGFSLRCLRDAKLKGAITIIERGSSHIEFQRDILKEEYELWGMKPIIPCRKIVEKEIGEYQEADYISIPSQFVKDTFLRKGVPEEKLIVYPYGVDPTIFRPIPKQDEIFRLVYVGNISIRKGVQYILKAVSELKLKNFELWLIGSVHHDIKSLLKKNEGSFQYLGYVDYRKLYKFYSQCSAFVMTSVEEGFAMVIPQAMACELPVLCTVNTGGKDIVRNAQDGFVMPIRDIEALKEKIIYLYNNPDICKAMGKSARQRVVDSFTWDDYGERIIGTYLSLLKK